MIHIEHLKEGAGGGAFSIPLESALPPEVAGCATYQRQAA